MRNIAFFTLGCKTNQYETDALTVAFKKNGYEITDFSNKADVYIINTCTVTSLSDRKSRQAIRKAKKLNPDSIVAVIGCYAQISPDEISSIEGVNIVLGTKDRLLLVELVEEAQKNNQFFGTSDIMQAESFEEMELAVPDDRTRAYVKIQEGCNQFCSYCIIPYARGPIRSRNPEKIISEVESLSNKGFKEIVITGIHIASYGVDLGTTSVIDILTELNKISGIERIRLGSLEPNLMNDDFLKKASELKKLCPHFHVSLQSGSNSILKAMNRKYSREEYKASVERLRYYFPQAAVTTDIMVGFPGETFNDFQDTLELAQDVRFSDIHVFKFSPRKGTPAAMFPNQVQPEIKDKRSEELLKLAEKLNNDFLNSYIGKELLIIPEKEKDEKKHQYEGLSDNYINVIVEGDDSILGRIIKVSITAREGNNLLAELA